MRRIFILAAAAALLVSSSVFANPPGPTPTLVVTPNPVTLPENQYYQVSGCNYTPGDILQVTVTSDEGITFSTPTVGSDTCFSTTFSAYEPETLTATVREPQGRGGHYRVAASLTYEVVEGW